MQMLDVGIGCMVNAKDLGGLDKMGFCDYGTLKSEMPNTPYTKVTLRNLLYSLIGSSEFSYKHKLGIDKIYNEFKSKINFVKYEKHIIEHKNAFLIGVCTETSLKLVGLLEYMFSLIPEIPDDLDEKYKYLPVLTDYSGTITFMYSVLSDANKDYVSQMGYVDSSDYIKISNKLRISVFKKATKITKQSDIFIEAIRQIIFGEDIKLINHVIFGLLGYNGVIDNCAFGSDYQFFYRKDGVNEGLADKLMKKYKPVSLFDTKLHYQDIIVPAIYDVYKVLETDKEIVLNSVNTFFHTVGGYIPVSLNGLKRILKNFQQMNNLASVYNLSVEFLSEVGNRKNILRNCVLSASCFNDEEEDIIVEAYSMFFKYALLDYMHKNHISDIDTTLQNLKDAYTSIIELDNTKRELEELRKQVAQLTNDNARLKTQLENKDDKKLHKEYYEMMRNISLTNERLEKELEKEKQKYKSVIDAQSSEDTKEASKEVVVEPNADLKNSKILFIGHEMAYSNVCSIEKEFKSVIFIDGMNSNIDVSKSTMESVDYVFIQYEFVTHKCKKHTDLARLCTKPVIRVTGTNKDIWLSQIKEGVKAYLKG